MLAEDKFLRSRNAPKIWERYCGFLDISLAEYMTIQKNLLLEQLDLIADSPWGTTMFRAKKPDSVEEFCARVPLTTYDDYVAYIGNCQENFLSYKPYYWAHTSGVRGSFKWVPYSERADEVLCKRVIGLIMLSLATRRGEVNLKPGIKVLSNLPPRPYITGYIAFSVAQRATWHNIPPLDMIENMEFQERIEKGFEIALRNNVDVVLSLSGVLRKLGDDFSKLTSSLKFSRRMLHPKIISRFVSALLRSKREGRQILPKDMWPVRSIISWGTDIALFKDKIAYCWGKEPYEFYGFTESGIVASQSWNRKGMTFFPDVAFFEFIPEKEWLKSREDKAYQPSTVLLDEVKAGQVYELVITNFYGMPFIRYRVGDLIKIISLLDEETGVNLPQMVFQSRSDGLIDIAGFTRLDERTIWQAIVNTKINHVDWVIQKEQGERDSILHLYIELGEDVEAKYLEELVHQQLAIANSDYQNLELMLGIKPLRVTLLPSGAFRRYYEAKKAAGLDLAHLKPPHINPSHETIQELLRSR